MQENVQNCPGRPHQYLTGEQLRRVNILAKLVSCQVLDHIIAPGSVLLCSAALTNKTVRSKYPTIWLVRVSPYRETKPNHAGIITPFFEISMKSIGAVTKPAFSRSCASAGQASRSLQGLLTARTHSTHPTSCEIQKSMLISSYMIRGYIYYRPKGKRGPRRWRPAFRTNRIRFEKIHDENSG